MHTCGGVYCALCEYIILRLWWNYLVQCDRRRKRTLAVIRTHIHTNILIYMCKHESAYGYWYLMHGDGKYAHTLTHIHTRNMHRSTLGILGSRVCLCVYACRQHVYTQE
jgi:hypothetical protein